uniref:MICOS complex subunit n=1 Tax=Meloidogyne javanica TaxID=6303 RepID=A0A915MK86_MELJA
MSSEISMKDLSVHDIHLENAFVYAIDTNLKVFAEAINVLSKISDQILLQPLADSLILTAYNSTKSAFAKIVLSSNFFSRFETPSNNEQNLNGEVYCRISTRNIGTKNVHLPSFENCQLELDPSADFAIIHMEQENTQIRKVYVLPMREHTTICDNVFTEKQRLKNKMATQAKVLLNLFGGFDCKEVRLDASANKLTAHRYIVREDLSRVRKTDVTIPIDHFEKFYIHVDTRIVISLRELRSILHFGNICGFTLNLHFDRPGRPMIVAIDENIDLTAEFVLATMDDFDAQQNQLPIYATKVTDSQDFYTTERKPVFGQEYFRQLRIATNNFFGIPELNLSKVTKTLEPVKDVASATENFIRKENTELFPKLAAISWGGMGGYLYGRRKGFIKKYFYTSIGLLVMTAFCYPNETIRVVRTGFEHSKMTWEEFKKSPDPDEK